ncbi:MAG: PriCT-2 domain-containing protein, partial [Neisseriaceae bacterium]|nr:PriCT-2 domain-containing protein [Neisseriaceae bacterium]
MAYSVPTENEIRTALTYIDATERQTWVSVGTALKTEFGETGFNLFDDWSQTAQNYKSKDAKDAWRSFRIGKSNIGYIINQAKQNGWVREKQQPMNANEMAERQRRNEAIAKQAENQRIKAQKAAAEYAQNIWNKAKPVNPNHAYLQKKGINNPSVLASIRQDKDALILPLRNRGEIVGIQKIFANGDKRFNRDIEKKGSALVIGNRDEMQHGFLMAEGFATAATLYIATGKPVVVAFDAGNLKEVSGSLKEFVQNHQTPVLICADKDENQTGEIKAQAAAEVLGNNATVITPDFSETEIQNFQAANNGKKPTDFNDLQAIGGIERVKTALADSFRLPETLSVIASRETAWQSSDLERGVSVSLNDENRQVEKSFSPIQVEPASDEQIKQAVVTPTRMANNLNDAKKQAEAFKGKELINKHSG